MSDAVLIAQLDALDAQIELLKVQAHGIRHRLTSQEPPASPSARQSLPDRCAGMEPSRCGVQDPDARISLASFTDTGAWRCRGCRVQDTSVAAGVVID